MSYSHFTVLGLNGGAAPEQPVREAIQPVAATSGAAPDAAGWRPLTPAQTGGAGTNPSGRFPTRPVHFPSVCPLRSGPGQDAYSAEQYRMVRTKILPVLKPPFRLLVTSPGMGDGKTVTAVNLAVAMALRSEEPTLLIDADLRRSTVHRLLQVGGDPGLAGILSGRSGLEDAIFTVEGLPGLSILPAGKPQGSPTELLDCARWRTLMDMLTALFAQIIVDTPPVEVVADYDLVEAACDGVLLVVRPDHTSRPLCIKAVERLRPKLTGVIVNAAPVWFLWRKPARYGYYYYSHGEGEGEESR